MIVKHMWFNMVNDVSKPQNNQGSAIYLNGNSNQPLSWIEFLTNFFGG